MNLNNLCIVECIAKFEFIFVDVTANYHGRGEDPA